VRQARLDRQADGDATGGDVGELGAERRHRPPDVRRFPELAGEPSREDLFGFEATLFSQLGDLDLEVVWECDVVEGGAAHNAYEFGAPALMLA
jgi:hypothetical protein